jgi:hypothetical protein
VELLDEKGDVVTDLIHAPLVVRRSLVGETVRSIGHGEETVELPRCKTMRIHILVGLVRDGR